MYIVICFPRNETKLCSKSLEILNIAFGEIFAFIYVVLQIPY